MPYEITYWRHRNREVDYVVRAGDALWAIEVKSGRPGTGSGLETFRREYPEAQTMVIGSGGWALEAFFADNPRDVFRA
ncbi:MAG: hypothetical protein JXQ29_03700 [Planctomycetes bacterium]|nr:hypothetical protein [Planctomycetota bacterium]